MAVYHVPYSCTHTIRQKIYGSWKKRIAYLSQLKKQRCPACRDADLPASERPTIHIFFRPDRDAAEILLTNCKTIKEQIWQASRTPHYEFITEEDCKKLSMQQVGWYKIVFPALAYMAEVNMAVNLGIIEIDYVNAVPEEIDAYLKVLEAYEANRNPG